MLDAVGAMEAQRLEMDAELKQLRSEVATMHEELMERSNELLRLQRSS